jgi:hypothetical protein
MVIPKHYVPQQTHPRLHDVVYLTTRAVVKVHDKREERVYKAMEALIDGKK